MRLTSCPSWILGLAALPAFVSAQSSFTVAPTSIDTQTWSTTGTGWSASTEPDTAYLSGYRETVKARFSYELTPAQIGSLESARLSVDLPSDAAASGLGYLKIYVVDDSLSVKSTILAGTSNIDFLFSQNSGPYPSHFDFDITSLLVNAPPDLSGSFRVEVTAYVNPTSEKVYLATPELMLTTVPEPATSALACAGAAGMAVALARRRGPRASRDRVRA